MPKLLKRLVETNIRFIGYLKSMGQNRRARRRILLLSGLLIAGLFIIVLIMILSVSQAETSLAELKRSWDEDKICHEDCSSKRKAIIDLIVKDLRSIPDSGTADMIKEYFFDQNVSHDFKKELVRIVSVAQEGNDPPDFFRTYLSDSQGDAAIRAKILVSFKPDSWFGTGNGDSSPSDYYFSILSASGDLPLRRAVVSALSNLPDKDQYFSLLHLDIIKGLIFDSGTDSNLRRDLIMLLGDYYPFFPKETAAVLRAFYKTDPSGDDIARAFAADLLNRLAHTDLKIPEVSQEQWADYYDSR